MSSLSDYVTRRLDAGRSGAEICAELMAVGWSKEAADDAYRDGLIALGIPLPDHAEASANTLPHTPAHAPAHVPTEKAATLDVAINLFSFILLGIVMGALITLSFSLVEQAFPEPHEVQADYLVMGLSRAIHRSIASVAIAFPLYAFAMAWWLRRFAGGKERSEARLTKWFTYLVLLIASVVIVCDLIALVYSLLQGETTTRFLLKVLIIFVLAGAVFGFYLFERRSVQFAKPVPSGVFRGFAWTASAAVLATLVVGYLVAGSPQTARDMAADAKRTQDLLDLSHCLERYARAVGQLPESLEQLERTSEYANCPTHDRQTGQRYAYRVVVASRSLAQVRAAEFELCAQFALASAGQRAPVPAGAENWFPHPAGRSCRVKVVTLGGTTNN